MNFINHLLTRKFGSRKTAGDGGGASPFLVEFFMVQGINFRCMAYRDADGRWRTAFEHEELTGSIQVLGWTADVMSFHSLFSDDAPVPVRLMVVLVAVTAMVLIFKKRKPS